jgi:hypothetical protein
MSANTSRIDNLITTQGLVTASGESGVVSMYFTDEGIGLLDATGSKIYYPVTMPTASSAARVGGTYFSAQSASTYRSASYAEQTTGPVFSADDSYVANSASWGIVADSTTSASLSTEASIVSSSVSLASSYVPGSPGVFTGSTVSNISIYGNTLEGLNLGFTKSNEILISGVIQTSSSLDGIITSADYGIRPYGISPLDGTHPTWKKVLNSNGNTYALSTDGVLYGMGENANGQLGTGNTNPGVGLREISWFRTNGWHVVNFWLQSKENESSKTTSVFTFVTSSAGQKRGFSFGYNGIGQLGINNTTNATTPTLFYSASEDILEVNSSLGLTTGHTAIMYYRNTSGNGILATGYNAQGQLATGNTTNSTIFDFTDMDAFGEMTTNASQSLDTFTTSDPVGNTGYLAVTSPTSNNHEIWIAGDNSSYQLSNNTTTGRSYFNPVYVSSGVTLKNIRKFKLGFKSWVGLSSTYALYVGGRNHDGCWGDGTAANSLTGYAKTLTLSNLPAAYPQITFSNGTNPGLAAGDFFLFSNRTGYQSLFVNLYVVIYDYETNTPNVTWQQTFAAGNNTWGQLGTGDISFTNNTVMQPVLLPYKEYLVDIKQYGNTLNGIGFMGKSNTGRLYVWGSSDGRWGFPYQVGISDGYKNTVPVQITDLNLR